MKVSGQPAYVLHTRAYRETSLLVDVFTETYGRITVLSKGARRQKTGLYAYLRPFEPLLISWAGKGNLPILTGAEYRNDLLNLVGNQRACGFYFNELIVYLLHKNDPHAQLFNSYDESLKEISTSSSHERVLRSFELRLLREVGYGLALDHDANNQSLIKAQAKYSYTPNIGMVEDNGNSNTSVSGQTLIDMNSNCVQSKQALQESKQLMRSIISQHLGDKTLFSRKLFRVQQACS